MGGRVATGTVNVYELVDILRSKNAGPFQITLDIMFKDPRVYRRVADSGLIDAALIARLYGVPLGRVLEVVNYDAARTIKATIARDVSSGTVGDTDVYGGQQHAPLLAIEIPSELVADLLPGAPGGSA
jgi:hypothetical protein